MTAASPTSVTRILRFGATAAEALAQPRSVLVLSRGLTALLIIWIASSLWRGVASFIPEAPALPPTPVINPMTPDTATSSRVDVDIEALATAPLFGVPAAGAEAELLAAQPGRAPTMSEEEAAEALAGIEKGAPQTRLPLRLRGVVAASEAGLGQAVIEHQNQQDLYQVGDDLPVRGSVVLAKVLPSLVVLDNDGRYEVLKLFEETELTRQAAAVTQQASRVRPVEAETSVSEESISVQGSADSGQIAARYRERLYEDPESLADVVLVSAVREGGSVRGYRVMPGKAADEFAALGFEAGDVVTAVNGLSLSEPANTMRLYQAMRSATSASFDLERNGSSMTLDVALDSTGSSR